MIDLKNRCRETLTYQFPKGVSAGPIRPQQMEVHRGKHNPKTGEKTLISKPETFGGSLSLRSKEVRKGLPDVVLSHPVIARDIAARRLVVLRQYEPPKRSKASVAPAAAPKPQPKPPKAPPKPPAKARRSEED